jgi:putative transport protein
LTSFDTSREKLEKVMDIIRATLEASPLAALFLTIAAGYLVGEINLKGFALGSGAVLFVGLACGAFAPKSAPPAVLGTLGLLLFLYCVGIQYGNEWYRGLTSTEGLKANFVGLCGLAAASVVSLVIYQAGAASLPQALGMFAGSSTSTPALQAILDALHDQDAAVGYSVTYPFGVAGPILCMYIYLALFKPRIEAPAGQRIEPSEVRVRNAVLFGKPLAELERTLPTGVQVVAVRDQQQNRVPTPSTIIDADHVLLLVGTDPVAIEKARTSIGEATSGELAADRTALDYLRVYASKRSAVGMPLGKLTIPGGFEYKYVQVRRGDTDLLPDANLVLEFGDRVGVLCSRGHFPAVRSFFGDSIKGAADFSYISIGVGAAMGLLAGMVPIPIPGIGRLTMGLAGVLLVALVLGKIRRTSGIVWTLPLSANLVLRNFGLTVFLAQVGISSGPKFAETIADTGLTFVLLGALIVLPLVLVTMIVGRLLTIPVDDLFGIVSGVTGNPAILGYASRAVATDRPDIGFATIFPSTVLMKILFVQVVAALLG